MSISFSSLELTKQLPAELFGDNFIFHSVSTDTRSLQAGDLFIALKGPNYNGHDFIHEAQAKGAIGALVQQEVKSNLPLLKVENTHTALGRLAILHRQRLTLPIVGVTGSCGKTTTKTMLANILKQKATTYATPGTLNNDIGVPLCLLQIASEHRYAVIEMGANHFGEIAYIAQMTHPDIAIITNAAPVHLEGFGNVEGVAKAKGEIFQGLSAKGIGVINADDAHFTYWQSCLASHSFLSFGLNPKADVTALNIHLDEQGKAQFLLKTSLGDMSIHLPTLGEHNVMNALAAAAAASALNIDLPTIKAGLETMLPVDKRLIRYTGINHCLVIDDSYNANPLAFSAAIQVLKRYPGHKVLVLGDMGELGNRAEEYHRQLGDEAKREGIDDLLATGNLSRCTVTAFGERGQHFANHNQLIEALKPLLQSDSVVLIKGSKSARMGQIVDAIVHERQA